MVEPYVHTRSTYPRQQACQIKNNLKSVTDIRTFIYTPSMLISKTTQTHVYCYLSSTFIHILVVELYTHANTRV